LKRRFSKILGVGLTLALLASFLVMAAPVSAVTTPVVTLTADPTTDAYVISKPNEYTILFTTGSAVPDHDEIVVVFQAGHNITGMVAGDIYIAFTEGIGGTSQTTALVVHDAVVTGTYPAAQTLTITPSATVTIGAGAIVQLIIGKLTSATTFVTNPSTTGSYKLTVATQTDVPVVIEAAVTSAAYTIKVPTIAGLPGVVSTYNTVGILMAQGIKIETAVSNAGPGYTVQVGPGTYTSEAIDIQATNQKGLTLVSTDGAATTIIEGTITVAAAEVTVEGFTVKVASGCAISVTGADAIVQNNVMTREGTAGYPEGINVTGSRATVSGNVLDKYNTMMVSGTDIKLSGNTFGAGINLNAPTCSKITITDNDLTGSELCGIRFQGTPFTDILIEGNTISGTTAGDVYDAGIGFRPDVLVVTNLKIIGNDITDNKGDGILIPSTLTTLTNCVIKFNTITGNDSDTVDYGIDNKSGADVDATLNWWGTTVAADIAKMVSGTATSPGIVDYDPFLAGTADAVLSATKAGTGATLDASTTVGVKVEGVDPATIISVAKYVANPQAAIADAIAFFDVYVANGGAADAVTLKFYAGDENSTLHVWSADTEAWVEMGLPDYTVGFSAYGGYVYVTVMADLLGRTPFAVVAGEAEAEELGAPDLATPTSGASDVSLTPIFAWEAVDDADGYYFEFADNANFVMPLVKLDGDMGRLLVTAYAYVGELPYSTAYYWKVKAVSGTVEAGDLAESGWASAIFVTMDEPVEPLPPIVIEPTPPAPPAPIITIEQPDIIVPLPAETPVTPGWIYAIIGVGAVLVIALLVLIVRTRRVA